MSDPTSPDLSAGSLETIWFETVPSHRPDMPFAVMRHRVGAGGNVTSQCVSLCESNAVAEAFQMGLESGCDVGGSLSPAMAGAQTWLHRKSGNLYQRPAVSAKLKIGDTWYPAVLYTRDGAFYMRTEEAFLKSFEQVDAPASAGSVPATKHELKCETSYFTNVANDAKPFEIRFNDRNYRVGDQLLLREYEPASQDGAGRYTGAVIERTVTYVSEFAQQPGWVVLGLSRPA